MIIDNSFKQGTVEWLQARLGVVTASRMGDVVTGLTCQPAVDQRAYAYRLVTERVIGERWSPAQTLEMFMGHANEGEARAMYSLLTGYEVEQVGMIFMDESRRVGASPDGLIINPTSILDSKIEYIGGIEIKNVSPHTQVEYLYSRVLPAKYRPQVYSSLYISGLDWWDFISCSPGLAPFMVRVNATDEDYLKYAKSLQVELPKFIELVDGIHEAVRMAV